MSITDSALLHLQLECSPSADDLAAFTPRRGPTLRVRLRVAEKAPRWLPYVVTRLGELAHLAYEPDDDVSSPHPEAVKRALPELVRFMGSDTPTPSVVPTFDGAVQFVWHKGGWDIEVEVGPKETLFWAQRRDGTTAWHGSLDEHLDTIRAVLSNLESPA